jgi:hypothetical protein
LIESFHTRKNEGTELLIIIDDDDDTYEQYHWEWDLHRGSLVGALLTTERLRLGGTLNKFGPEMANRYDIVGFMGDDHRPRTEGWDVEVAKACANTPNAVVYGNDLLQGQALATAVFMDSAIIKALGYMVFPGGVHLFFDNFWMDIGRGLGTLTYLSDVIIEHVHPSAGKVEWDHGYNEVNSSDTWIMDENTYKEYVAYQLSNDVQRVRSY